MMLRFLLLLALLVQPSLPLAQSTLDAQGMDGVEREYALSAQAAPAKYAALVYSQVLAFQQRHDADWGASEDRACPLWLMRSTPALRTVSAAVESLQAACRAKGIALPKGAEVNPHTLPAYRYDPVLLSLIAGLETRSYSRGPAAQWQQMALRFPSGHDGQYFARPVAAHFLQGSRGDDRLFVLMNSSYSTWKRGTWTNKTVVALRTAFPSCHILVLAGFLTPEILASQPQVPDLTGEKTAQDLYVRLRSFVADKKRDGTLPEGVRTGLVGFSGGANVVLSLLQQDAVQGGSPGGTLFPMGGIAYSPIVDLAGTFTVLDGSSKALLTAGFPPRHGLTTLPNMLGLALKGYLPGHVSNFLNLLSPHPSLQPVASDFIGRFYREFEIVDLQSVIAAPYTGAPPCGREPSFSEYYRGCLFPWYQQRFEETRGQTFEEYSDLRRLTDRIDAPVYVVFALDDPVLSRSLIDATVKAQKVEEALEALRRNPHVRVFAPPQGGHLGYLLDSSFLYRAGQTFFSTAKTGARPLP